MTTDVIADERSAISREYEQAAPNLPRAALAARLPPVQRRRAIELAASLDWPWLLQRRHKQRIRWDDPRWFTWANVSARGTGTTYWLSNGAHEGVYLRGETRLGIMGRSYDDVHDVMLDGESGIFHTGPKRLNGQPIPPPEYKRGSRGRTIVWPATGAEARLFSSEEPRNLRGPFRPLWIVDQLESFMPHVGIHAWDAMLGTLRNKREGQSPHILVGANAYATDAILDLMSDPDAVVLSESIYDNEANLDEKWIANMERRFEGTDIGEAEIHGNILLSPSGAVFQRHHITNARKVQPIKVGEADEALIAVDPAKTANKGSDYTAINAMGAKGGERVWTWSAEHYREPAEVVLTLIADAWDRYGGQVVIEDNVGGDWITGRMRDRYPHIPVTGHTETRGQRERYQALAALYGEGRVGHALDNKGQPLLTDLEAEMLRWPQHKNDDLLAAQALGVSRLLIQPKRKVKFYSQSMRRKRRERAVAVAGNGVLG